MSYQTGSAHILSPQPYNANLALPHALSANRSKDATGIHTDSSSSYWPKIHLTDARFVAHLKAEKETWGDIFLFRDSKSIWRGYFAS